MSAGWYHQGRIPRELLDDPVEFRAIVGMFREQALAARDRTRDGLPPADDAVPADRTEVTLFWAHPADPPADVVAEHRIEVHRPHPATVWVDAINWDRPILVVVVPWVAAAD